MSEASPVMSTKHGGRVTSFSAQLRSGGQATEHYCHLAFWRSSSFKQHLAVLTNHIGHIRHTTMGNLATSCSVTNNSKRNIRVFVTDKSLEMDAFIASQSGGNDKITAVLPAGKKFIFRKDVKHVRVLASQTQPVPLESNPINASYFVSVFVEDEEDENICSKQIMHNMPLSGAATVLLYDV